MSDTAIRVENLGKQYHIGRQQARYKTIRETIVDGAKAPFRSACRLNHSDRIEVFRKFVYDA